MSILDFKIICDIARFEYHHLIKKMNFSLHLGLLAIIVKDRPVTPFKVLFGEYPSPLQTAFSLQKTYEKRRHFLRYNR